MFVSTRAATRVELFPRPPAVLRGRHSSPLSVPLALSPRRRVEQSKLLGDAQWFRGLRSLDTDRISRGYEPNLVPGTNSVPIRDRLGDRDLQLARDFGHEILTIARTISLLETRRRRGILSCATGRSAAVAYLLWEQMVAGSIPAAPTMFSATWRMPRKARAESAHSSFAPGN